MGPAIEGIPEPEDRRGDAGLAPDAGPRSPAPALNKPTNYGPSVTQLGDIRVLAVHDSGYSGAGVVVAMFDTGYNETHSATIQLKRIAERISSGRTERPRIRSRRTERPGGTTAPGRGRWPEATGRTT